MTELMQPTRVVDDIRTFFDTTQADPRAIELASELHSWRPEAR